MADALKCPANADQSFGPRVDPRCRSFDFTLTFEDVILGSIGPSLFLLLWVSRLHVLYRRPLVAESRALVLYKLEALAALFVTQLAYFVVQITSDELRTRASIAAPILNLVATVGVIFLSYTEHGRNVRPSSLLILYLSLSSITAVPKLRTLWLLPHSTTAAALWTASVVLTLVTVVLESWNKVNSLRSTHQPLTKEEVSNFWVRASFFWTLPLFRNGYTSILSLDDIPEVDKPLGGYYGYGKLRATWAKIESSDRGTSSPKILAHYRRRYAMFRATILAFSGTFLSAIIPRLCLTCFMFSQTFLITATIEFIEEPTTDETQHYGQALIGAYVLVYLGYAVSTAIYWRQTFRFIMMARAGLISMLYSKTTELKSVQLQDSAAITLMGTDVERIVVAFKSIHEVWASLLDIGIAIWLLERQIFVACVVPAIIAVSCILAMMKVSALSNKAQKLWVERVEKRLHITSKTLGDMKAVKMLGLSDTLSSIVKSLRETEIQVSKKLRKLLVWQILLSNMPLDLAPFATFAVFTAIAATKHSASLLTAQAFTSLALISLLTYPLLTFILAVPSLVQCLGCFERIQDYCRLNPSGADSYRQPSASASSSTVVDQAESDVELYGLQSKASNSENILTFQHASFAWHVDGDHVLKNLSLKIRRNKITMIIGSVGSGKSTLLQSILGETIQTTGKMSPITSSYGYCHQTPWVMNDTIRNNVILSKPYDEQWYTHVMWACGLDGEFELAFRGDLLQVGSKGVTLSGGQKQRIALARTIYSRSPVVLLDDVFSGIDAKSTKAVAERLMGPGGYIRKYNVTLVLATHSQSLLRYADAVVQLQDGEEVQGQALPLPESLDEVDSETQNVPAEKERSGYGDKGTSRQPTEAPSRPARVATAQSEKSAAWRKDGDWSVYGYYVRAAGVGSCILFFIFIFSASFCNNFPTLWLKWWSDANTSRPNKDVGLYLGIYGFLSASAILSLLVASWVLFLPLITQSALGLHADLLTSTFRAPWSFFETTDIGKTTNRFSQDMDLVDMKLPVVAINVMSEAANCVVKIAILCAVAKYLAITVPFLGLTLYALQRCYLHTSRQVRLLDIEAKSPLYSHFLETVGGIVTIRAFSATAYFEAKAMQLLDTSQKPVYMLYCVQQWLTLVLDLIVGAMAVILVATTVSLKSSFSASSVGVALTTVLTFNQALTSLIKYWTLLETSIGAVARVQNFVRDTPSEERTGPTQSASRGWPSRGAIEFRNISVTHSPTTPPVLRNLTLSITPGEKLAICGRSGSGKTTLILSLLQMKDLKSGTITLDGLDLSTLPCDTVRSSINTIPQDPFFPPGTLRFSMDPGHLCTDQAIESAIQRVGLGDKVRENGGLEGTAAVESWSMGQQQLLSLARAMLKKSKILVLDEAMSSVDHDTEALMQGIIEKEFANHTVISVVHRLDYIQCYDRVGLLDNGVLVECDSPAVLLATDSHVRRLLNSRVESKSQDSEQ